MAAGGMRTPAAAQPADMVSGVARLTLSDTCLFSGDHTRTGRVGESGSFVVGRQDQS